MRIVGIVIAALVLIPVGGIATLFVLPRPADTTEASVLEGDGSTVDYCDFQELSGSTVTADDIPVAYTPGCSWEVFPMPVLDRCTEPLGPGVEDLRGLWQATSGLFRHVEPIEQCGDRVVVTSAGIIHDMRADGTLRNGANDVNPSCMRIFAAAEWVDGALVMRPLGGPFAHVTRHREGDELVWDYPVAGVTRMKRICRLPDPA